MIIRFESIGYTTVKSSDELTYADDDKNLPYADNMCPGFDLVGVQIRKEKIDAGNYYGTEGAGLRFIAVLSEGLYKKHQQHYRL